MSNESQSLFTDAIKQSAGLTIGVGALVLLMGLLAMGAPLVAGLSLAIMVGSMLIIGGIGQLIIAFKAGRGVMAMILGLLTVIIGGYMVMNPGAALASLTIFLAVYLIVSGICEAVVALQARPLGGWGMALFSGIVSLILGAMIWSQFPLSGAWAIGILIGAKLFFSGLSLPLFGFTVRSAAQEPANAA
jgi:uncharacterized membrane protein HdeD (DUF308 family)